VVGAVRESGVVARPGGLGDAHRLGAHLHDQGLADAPPRLVRGGDAEAAGRQPRHVLHPAGERHHRVQRQRQDTRGRGRSQHGHPARPAGVGHDLSGPQRPGGGQPAHQPGQRVVRHGQQHQVGLPHHLVRRQQRDTGQQLLGASHGGVGHARGGDDLMTGAGQRGAQHGPDPAGGHHADREPGRAGGRRDVVGGHGGASFSAPSTGCPGCRP
jgi:hypothetical protein